MNALEIWQNHSNTCRPVGLHTVICSWRMTDNPYSSTTRQILLQQQVLTTFGFCLTDPIVFRYTDFRLGCLEQVI